MYDLLIKDGTVVDGSGGAGYRADVAVQDGKIAAIGRLNGKARQTLTPRVTWLAQGLSMVMHMDAQVLRDPLGSCSCYHGVTSVVMGSCGFTLAPCKQEDADLVFRNPERAEDLSQDAWQAWVDVKRSRSSWMPWMRCLKALTTQATLATRVATYVMGEQAFSETATEDDTQRMQAVVQEAMHAGAVGFSTSRTFNHITADDRPVASRLAEWDEVRAIVNAVGETGKGIFEIAGEAPGRDPERIREYCDRLRDLAVESGVIQTWGMFSVRAAPDLWRPYFDLLDETAAAGGRMFAQVHSRALSSLLSFESYTPYDNWEYWSDMPTASC